MAGRTIGATAYSQADKAYIKDNWMRKTDLEMAKALNRSEESLAKYRCALGLTKYSFSIHDNKTKALICEMYICGNSLSYISKITGKREYDISLLLIKCLSVIPLTDRSKVIVRRSKV
jgi:hypothetical protein